MSMYLLILFWCLSSFHIVQSIWEHTSQCVFSLKFIFRFFCVSIEFSCLFIWNVILCPLCGCIIICFPISLRLNICIISSSLIVITSIWLILFFLSLFVQDVISKWNEWITAKNQLLLLPYYSPERGNQFIRSPFHLIVPFPPAQNCAIIECYHLCLFLPLKIGEAETVRNIVYELRERIWRMKPRSRTEQKLSKCSKWEKNEWGPFFLWLFVPG